MIERDRALAMAERALYLERFAELGVLGLIREAVLSQSDIGEDQIGELTCLPAWFEVEQQPGSERDLRVPLGEDAYMPQLTVDCSWPAIGGGREGVSMPVSDPELCLDEAQVQQIAIWASARAPIVFKC